MTPDEIEKLVQRVVDLGGQAGKARARGDALEIQTKPSRVSGPLAARSRATT